MPDVNPALKNSSAPRSNPAPSQHEVCGCNGDFFLSEEEMTRHHEAVEERNTGKKVGASKSDIGCRLEEGLGSFSEGSSFHS